MTSSRRHTVAAVSGRAIFLRWGRLRCVSVFATTRGYLTIKGRSNEAGISRYEFETEVPLQDAEDLMRLCEPGVIDKTRYLVRSGRHVFEVDEFYGDNEGLIMAEVELSDEQGSF